ncbi:hypothetical protein F4X86_03295 [Candidatus Saccharibacteria bacterium]|nr:hypothetical protein [Candidatus Saccharibacteria bacterium]
MKDKVTQQELVDKIKAADNILIMTSAQAKVDQLATCIGLFRILRDMDKNPALVYSKDVPGAINFLEPEKAIQADAESLRDFIISFDRKKVDKFRYNQEGDQYNILLTPSRLEVITESDMKYRKGDFNIDFILAVGVDSQSAVDPAVSEHKQLMDELPLVNLVAGKKSSSWEVSCWQDEDSPAVAEMAYELGKALGADSFSKQVANSLLTGIIDQTERYKTKQTKSRTMHVSADLLEMGADLQMINENLSKAGVTPVALPEEETKEIIEDALGEAGEYDTKLIKNRKKKAGSGNQRQYMRQGDVAESGISYGEKAASKKDQEQEYKLDKLNIDEEGNLRIVSEEEGGGAGETDAPDQKTAPAMAAAEQAQPPAASDGQAQQAPSMAASAAAPAATPAMPHPALNAPAAADSSPAPHPALGAAAAPAMAAQPQAQAPSISEIVDKTAAAPGAPAVPGLNEKVAAMSPVNPSSASSYIDSLAGSSAAAPGAPAAPAANPDQAMTVDSYLAQQQAPAADQSAAGGSYAPPSAPPLASMS